MGKKSKHTIEEKTQVVLDYKNGSLEFFYSQHVIIILVGNKSWVKEHTNGY